MFSVVVYCFNDYPECSHVLMTALLLLCVYINLKQKDETPNTMYTKNTVHR